MKITELVHVGVVLGSPDANSIEARERAAAEACALVDEHIDAVRAAATGWGSVLIVRRDGTKLVSQLEEWARERAWSEVSSELLLADGRGADSPIARASRNVPPIGLPPGEGLAIVIAGDRATWVQFTIAPTSYERLVRAARRLVPHVPATAPDDHLIAALEELGTKLAIARA